MSVAEMCMLRWMCANMRRDKVRNKDILTKIDVASIEEKMKENRLWWFGHVLHKPTDALVRRVETINLGQVKRAKGEWRKHEWRWYDKDIEAKSLNEGILLDRNERKNWSMCPIRCNSLLVHVAYPQIHGINGLVVVVLTDGSPQHS